ncbi:phosphoribosylformylglycinamidine cyclo-ligase [Rhodohalobacter sp. SW132]|uniref:phosphoribosylformylglycinamidine cyclo-ligase n=1 Tax=Rhodohalobacter sp. SW132 TaxID=2293433 RepID=UPI000E228046|nr:phosphoribosylformylglycinamidine cyclo-ligase [Rhodohalobacter sp. SW132]REL39172.1 phosphoribosylformylglycinamidine cyclo-ligase [Rhodohalobacter sp. SW132]
MNKKQFTYKDSGVDVEAGEELVNSIKDVVKETHNVSVLSNIGGFGALFQPDFSSMKEPVLVSSVDGVGTKLIVAFKSGKYNTVGQDLVNHCVNDIAVCGATPLFFLDYFSTGSLEKEVGFQVISGFAKACRENGVALIGGETAEMPDIYQKGEFDLAGTIVGAVDKSKLITGNKIQKGDLVLGFKSSGLHTNGYSLARNVLFSEFELDDSPDEIEGTISEELLSIHKSYLPLISGLKKIEGVNGFSHITGGGLISNTNRVLPEGLELNISWDSWERPGIFKLIKKTGNVPEDDMRRTFNLGIGLVSIINPEVKDQVIEAAERVNETVIEIGEVE